MNYEVIYIDFIQSGINETELSADNVSIFNKFSEAKKELIRRALYNKNEICERIRELRHNRKEDFGLN